MKRSDFIKSLGCLAVVPLVPLQGMAKKVKGKLWGTSFIGCDDSWNAGMHDGKGLEVFITVRRKDGKTADELNEDLVDVLVKKWKTNLKEYGPVTKINEDFAYGGGSESLRKELHEFLKMLADRKVL